MAPASQTLVDNCHCHWMIVISVNHCMLEVSIKCAASRNWQKVYSMGFNGQLKDESTLVPYKSCPEIWSIFSIQFNIIFYKKCETKMVDFQNHVTMFSVCYYFFFIICIICLVSLKLVNIILTSLSFCSSFGQQSDNFNLVFGSCGCPLLWMVCIFALCGM